MFSTNFTCDACLDCTANQALPGQNVSKKAGSRLVDYKSDKKNSQLDKAQYDSTSLGQSVNMITQSSYEDAGVKSQ